MAQIKVPAQDVWNACTSAIQAELDSFAKWEAEKLSHQPTTTGFWFWKRDLTEDERRRMIYHGDSLASDYNWMHRGTHRQHLKDLEKMQEFVGLMGTSDPVYINQKEAKWLRMV